jgi:hypothetical protein
MSLRYFEAISLSPSQVGLINAQLDDDELVHRLPPRCFKPISPIKALDSIPEFDAEELERILLEASEIANAIKQEPITPDVKLEVHTPHAPARPARPLDFVEFPLENKENMLPIVQDEQGIMDTTIEWGCEDPDCDCYMLRDVPEEREIKRIRKEFNL